MTMDMIMLNIVFKVKSIVRFLKDFGHAPNNLKRTKITSGICKGIEKTTHHSALKIGKMLLIFVLLIAIQESVSSNLETVSNISLTITGIQPRKVLFLLR